MSDIRQKIMALNYDPSSTIGVTRALYTAADIAEAEVARLEALVRELEDIVASLGGYAYADSLSDVEKRKVWLIANRSKRRMTCREVSDKSGLKISDICDFEGGRKPIDAVTFNVLRRVIGGE